VAPRRARSDTAPTQYHGKGSRRKEVVSSARPVASGEPEACSGRFTVPTVVFRAL